MAKNQSEVPKISQPVITKKPNGLFFTWEHGVESHIAIGITRINQEFNRNSIEAEIEVGLDSTIYHTNNGDLSAVVGYARTNLLSLSARETLRKNIEYNCLSEVAFYIPWHQVVNQIASYAIREIRKGEPLTILDETYGLTRPEYLLHPLFVKNAVNIIYADKSSAKSLLAILISLGLTYHWGENTIGWTINEPHKLIYLDWENDPAITGWVKECLARGTGLHCDIPYLRCSRPLADMTDHILGKVIEQKADVVIIDSLGMAVGDDLNLTKPAFAFYSALRQLPVTPIIIAHTSKDISNKRKTVYGNAYYENEARTVWEVSKDQQPGSNELVATLHQRKAPPFAGYHDAMAYRFIFDEDRTMVEAATPQTDKREAAEERTNEDKILSVLMMTDEHLSASEILSRSKENIKEGSIRTQLKRLATKTDPDIAQDENGKYYYLI